MDNKRIFPSLVCGFGAAVLVTVPGIKSLGCCLIVPFAVVLSLILDHRINKVPPPVTIKKAVFFGFLTGIFTTLFATFFEVIVTYFTKTNEFIQVLPQIEGTINQYNLTSIFKDTITLYHQMALQITTNGFSLLYTIMIFFSYGIIYTIFGILGGFIGMVILNKRT